MAREQFWNYKHPHEDLGHTFIQWKGTDVCMDIGLPCGCSPHIDGDFAYFVRCCCGNVWQLAADIPLRLVTEEELTEWQISPYAIKEENG